MNRLLRGIGLMVALVLLPSLGWSEDAQPDGLIRLASPYSVGDTADRLQHRLEAKGMTLFARIDHSAGASAAGLSLPPTQLLIFGNPKVGTALMQCAQSVAIDLPQKVLISQHADGQVWLSYNDPAYLARRHQIQGCDVVLTKIGNALAAFANAATAR